MKRTSLQALIRLNASMITEMHSDVGFLKDFIKHSDHISRNAAENDIRELALANEYSAVKALRKVKPALDKAVEIQKEMKTELSFIHREARINRGLDKLVDAGVTTLAIPMNATSHQLEGIVNAELRKVFPAKPDSRVVA